MDSLHTLTAKKIIESLDASNLDALLSVMTKMYRVTFKRFTWTNDAEEHSTIFEEGIVGTYIDIENMEKGLQTHKEYMNTHWWSNSPSKMGNIKLPIDELYQNPNKKVYSLCSSNGVDTFYEGELHYYIEPLIRT